jgi:UDP-N-acetylglucosamine:LPS N-acetylglucosamine transferase
VDADALLELETALGVPKFRGYSIGSLLGDFYTVSMFNGHARWSAASMLAHCARWCYRCAHGITTGIPPSNTGRDKYLITSIDIRPTLAGLVFPVIEALGPDNCVVIGQPGVQALLPRRVEFLSWDALPRVDMSEWRSAYFPGVAEWLRTLSAFRKLRRLPYGFIPELLDWTASQTQRVLAYERLLEIVRPATVLTEFDRNHLVAPLMIAARVKRVPTITLVHGVANRLYTPLLADVVCCWGESDRATFANCGVEAGRIVVTGQPRIQREVAPINAERKSEILGRSTKCTLLFASSPIATGLKLKLAGEFCEAVSALPNTAAIIRLHPSECVSEYRHVSDAHPAAIFLPNNACTLDEALSLADVIVVHNSSVGIDALIRQRPTVVLDSVAGEWPNAAALVQHAHCPVAKDGAELQRVLAALVADDALRAAVIEWAAPYARGLCVAYGSEAAARIADTAKRMAANSGRHLESAHASLF